MSRPCASPPGSSRLPRPCGAHRLRTCWRAIMTDARGYSIGRGRVTELGPHQGPGSIWPARFCRHVRATSTVQPGHRWVYGVRAVCTSAAAAPGRVGPVAAGAHMLHDLMKRIRPGFAAVVRAREQPKDPRQGGVAAGPSVEPPVRCGDRVGHRLVQSVGVLSTSARQPCSRSCRTASPCRACSRRRTSCAGRASRQP